MSIDVDETEVLAALAAAGYHLDSVSDFFRAKSSYKSAIPVLLDELAKKPSPRIAEMIVRALSVPWARPMAVQPLIDLFLRQPDEYIAYNLRWVIGNALEVIWDDKYLDQLAGLASNSDYGRSREMIVLGLAKSKDPRAVGLLLRLAEDPTVSGHAVNALRKLKAPEARAVFENALSDPRAWVRRSARAGLNRIGEAAVESSD